MKLQVVIIAAYCTCILSAVTLSAQVPDAAEKTQSAFDEHKSADPTNSDRSLTSKTRRTEAHISQVPLPAAPSAKTLQRLKDLKAQRDSFVQQQLKREEAKPSSGFRSMAAESGTAKTDPTQEWEKNNKASAAELRRLEAEVREAYKKRRREEARISDVPVSKTTR